MGDAHGTDQSYKLVWQEEFSGTKLDRKKWVAVDDPKIGQYGHGNGESQAYLDAEGETFFIKDGRLTIIANHAPDAKYPLRDKPYGKFKRNIDHQDFKSAKLTTEKLRAFTYGIFEARIKNPTDARGQRTAIVFDRRAHRVERPEREAALRGISTTSTSRRLVGGFGIQAQLNRRRAARYTRHNSRCWGEGEQV